MVFNRLDGPALHQYQGIFFIFQILLVWTAFFQLRRRPVMSTQRFGLAVQMNRGGYLMTLFAYETICVVLTLVFSMALFYPTSMGFERWQRAALLYWYASHLIHT